jgi:hypothetical protein
MAEIVSCDHDLMLFSCFDHDGISVVNHISRDSICGFYDVRRQEFVADFFCGTMRLFFSHLFDE